MKKAGHWHNVLLAAMMMLLLCTTGAEAVMRDFGPLNIYGFPSWYRDHNGLAVQQCFSRAVSPVSALPICNILPNPDSNPPFDANLPITFPPNPPTGYNFPDESFYYSIGHDTDTFAFAAGKGRIVVVLALEAAFNVGDPIPGDQVVFSRVRVYLTQGVPDGNYKITHPYGVENLTVTGGLLRYTRDIGIAGVPFTGPLVGDMGPFFRWTVDPALVASGAQNPDGTLNGVDPVTGLPNGDVFLGDFNTPHTFTGSPFGTNYFRCDGPVGSEIGGPGKDWIETDLGLLEGWKYTTPIPSPLAIDRLTYERDAVTGQIDVFATTSPLSNEGTPSSLTISGANLPTTVMTKDAAGKFFAHIDTVVPNLFPSQVTVTNTADNPPTAVTGNLADNVAVTAALYEPNAQTLTVQAFSYDLLTNPALTLEGFGPIPPSGTLTVPGVTVPPPFVKVVSAAHGSGTGTVLVRKLAAPVAVDDAAGVAQGSSVPIGVLANDGAAPPATLVPATIEIGSAPTLGTTSIAAGVITYTSTGAAGTDSFTYRVQDSNSLWSNYATVRLTIAAANVPPVANNDAANATVGIPANIKVLLNDTATTSALDPASVVIETQPGVGATATVVPVDGSVNFTATVPGIYSFQYSVKDTFATPATSNIATVVVTAVAANVPPVANSDSGNVVAGASVTINVVANDTDADGIINPATVVIATPPTNGAVTINVNGTVTYTPAAGYTGPDSFTYNIKDNAGAVSNDASVAITVTPPLTETITVTRAQFTLNGAQWRVEGTTTARVNGETMMVFNSATVPADIVANPPMITVTVAGNGSWTWSSPNGSTPPNGLRRISVLSSLNGKRENVTVTIR